MNSIYAKKIYTGRKIVADAYVVFSGNRFAGVSQNAKGSVLGKFPIITPAFVDPHSHIGMARAGEPNDQSEANDQTDSILAWLMRWTPFKWMTVPLKMQSKWACSIPAWFPAAVT
jgi:imidazolonepropionase-like amidohydrolase